MTEIVEVWIPTGSPVMGLTLKVTLSPLAREALVLLSVKLSLDVLSVNLVDWLPVFLMVMVLVG